MVSFIVSYEDAVSLGPPIVGGKGWNLGRLHRYGFPVPTGGILSAHVYRQFMREPKLLALCADLAGVQAGDVADAGVIDKLRVLRTAIEATTFSTEVEDAVKAFLADSGLADMAVAVRSSATAEDGTDTSFAGIHDSYLNVQGTEHVLQAIKGCYGSLWTPRALTYRRRMGLKDEAVECAVLICAMITGPMQSPPVAAGVAFSCDPRTGQRDRVTVNAAPGWGDAVVSSKVSPEEISVVQRYDGKPLRIERVKGCSQVLADEQIIALASLVRRVMWALGDGQEPQDVEWVYDGEHFSLVQARPVTHLPRVTLPAVAELPTIWSNANLKDVMIGVLTPLSWSILQPIVSTILYAPCQEVGYALPEGVEVMRRFSGRAYFDLTTMLWSYCDTLGVQPHDVNKGMGGHQPEIPVPSKHLLRGWAGLRRIRGRLRLLSAIARIGRTLPGDMKRLREKAKGYADRPLTKLSAIELLALLQQVNEQARIFGHRFQLANMGGVWTDYLTHLLERKFPEQAQALSAALMAGSREVESAEHAYRLYEVAIAARHDPDARAYLADHSLDPQGWRNLPAQSAFVKAFKAFLDDFGHRGVYEFEIANPRWSEDQSYLLDCIRALLTQEVLVVPYEMGRTMRLAAEAQVAGLPLRLRLFVSWFAREARRGATYREGGKSTLVALLEPMRAIVLEIGRRMAVADILEEIGDIFFLTWSDLVAFLRGEWDGQGARALVEDRKEQRHAWLTEMPADVFVCDSDGHPAALPVSFESRMAVPVARRDRQSGSNTEKLQGIAASPGQVIGHARIIRHPDEGLRLQAGEVLVAPSTDPGWTPLFLRACAVVMETGGYLSHGAIVAREFGIPAVVNIPGLLEVVDDGRLLTVDGSKGYVTLGGSPRTH